MNSRVGRLHQPVLLLMILEHRLQFVLTHARPERFHHLPMRNVVHTRRLAKFRNLILRFDQPAVGECIHQGGRFETPVCTRSRSCSLPRCRYPATHPLLPQPRRLLLIQHINPIRPNLANHLPYPIRRMQKIRLIPPLNLLHRAHLPVPNRILNIPNRRKQMILPTPQIDEHRIIRLLHARQIQKLALLPKRELKIRAITMHQASPLHKHHPMLALLKTIHQLFPMQLIHNHSSHSTKFRIKSNTNAHIVQTLNSCKNSFHTNTRSCLVSG